MGLSRYRNVNTLEDKKYYATSDFPSQDILDEISTFKIVISKFDRLDQLAAKHLGDGTYWWVIALINNIDWMFKFDEGQIIKIPVDVNDVLRLF